MLLLLNSFDAETQPYFLNAFIKQVFQLVLADDLIHMSGQIEPAFCFGEISLFSVMNLLDFEVIICFEGLVVEKKFFFDFVLGH